MKNDRKNRAARAKAVYDWRGLTPQGWQVAFIDDWFALVKHWASPE